MDMLTEKALLQTAQSYVEAGKELLSQGGFEEALSSARTALHFQANYVDAYDLIGEIYARQKRWNKCVEICRERLQLDPNNSQAYVTLGDALRHCGQAAQALKICNRAARQNLSSPGLYRLMGNLMESDQRFERAIHYYRKFLELRPNSGWGHVFLARSFKKQGQFNEVSQCCDQAMKCPRVIPDIFRLKAHALMQLNKLDAAIDCYRRYLEMRPESSMVYVELGNVLLKEKRYDEVIDCCLQAKQQKKIEPAIYRLLGAAFQHQDLIDGAISNYRTFLQHKPEAGWIYAALGKALRKARRLDEALDCFKEAEKRGHAQQNMNQFIADIYKEQNRLDESVPYYQKVLQLKSEKKETDMKRSIQGHQRNKRDALTGATVG